MALVTVTTTRGRDLPDGLSIRVWGTVRRRWWLEIGDIVYAGPSVESPWSQGIDTFRHPPEDLWV